MHMACSKVFASESHCHVAICNAPSLVWGLENPVWEPNHEGELEEEVPDLDEEEEFKTLDIHPNHVQAI